VDLEGVRYVDCFAVIRLLGDEGVVVNELGYANILPSVQVKFELVGLLGAEVVALGCAVEVGGGRGDAGGGRFHLEDGEAFGAVEGLGEGGRRDGRGAGVGAETALVVCASYHARVRSEDVGGLAIQKAA
jgi:hypothetical protein